MSELPWFRAYTKMVDDEKLRLLAFEDRWHFMAILCLKGQGILDNSDPLMLRKVAVKMGLDLRTLEEVARRLDEVGLIDKATLQPVKWDSLQHRSDADTTAAERKRRQRQRERSEADAGNEKPPVCADPHLGKQPENMSRVTVTNVTRTDTDTDTDKEEEKDKKHKRDAAPGFVLPDWIPADTWAAFMETRKAKKAKSTDYALSLIVKSLERLKADGHDPVEVLDTSIKAGWSDVYPPKAAFITAKRAEPEWRAEQKNLIAEHFPNIAARSARPSQIIDMETQNGHAIRLD